MDDLPAVFVRERVTDLQVARVLAYGYPARRSLDGRADSFPTRNLILYPEPLLSWRVLPDYVSRVVGGWQASVELLNDADERVGVLGVVAIRVELTREGLVAEWRRQTGGGVLEVVTGETCDASPAVALRLAMAIRVLVNEAVAAVIRLRVFGGEVTR